MNSDADSAGLSINYSSKKKMFKFQRFTRLLSDERQNRREEKILAGTDLRTQVNRSLEVTVANMTQTAVNELFVEKLSRPSSV